MSDDGFGPPQRGGSSRPGASRDAPAGDDASRAPAGPTSPQGGPGEDAGDGFGPAQRGRAPRLPRPRRRARRERDRSARGGHRRRRRGPRPLRVAGAALLVLLLAVSALVATALLRMERVDVDGLSWIGPTQANVLVAGSDAREGFTEEQAQDVGAGQVEGERFDTLFVLAVDGTDVGVLALPRDLYVTLCDGTQGRINAATTRPGGRSCLVETVRDLTGLSLSHYVELDLAGFVDLVDAVGGVELTLDEPIRDERANADLPAGRQRLDGVDALSFVRVRGIDDDLGRIGRQQEFVQALARELASPSTLANPVRLTQAAWEGGAALTVNRAFGPLGAAQLGVASLGMREGMPTYLVPATPQTIGGAAVLVPQEQAAAELFAAFRDRSALDAEPGEEDLPGADP